MAAGAASWLLATTVLLGVVSWTARAQTLSAEECAVLGFTGRGSCADCESFAEYVKDDELVAECKQCCVPDKTVQYTSARLEVCPYRLSGLPAIKDFMDKKAKPFTGAGVLTIVERMGAYPKLTCTAEGGAKLSVRIDNWKAQQIVDFLNEKLGMQPAA